ncbi:uncharacterized protein LOC128248056 [Octopus bimaculoides]|uniref:uncharacterized protein LOC128248056 n=1 Tax=Octopus bimaculoides TaxID=37653 RepID=UPI0022DEFEA9|nr:uncharacterized protein LOC128248056 [Octopus bimaculoides]
MIMTRLFPFCFLFLTALTAFIEAHYVECHGCFYGNKCRKNKQRWFEKTTASCAWKSCELIGVVQWQIITNSVYCRREDGTCIRKDTTWVTFENGICWTHECKYLGIKRVDISSKSGGICLRQKRDLPIANRSENQTSLL